MQKGRYGPAFQLVQIHIAQFVLDEGLAFSSSKALTHTLFSSDLEFVELSCIIHSIPGFVIRNDAV